MSEEPVSQGMEDTQGMEDAPASAEPVPQIIHGVFAFPNPDKSKHFIRFIDSRYNDFFKVPDGGNIIATTRTGIERTVTCRYIDDYHALIGVRPWHICEFAEAMERAGEICRPENPQPGDNYDSYEIFQLISTREYGYTPYEDAKDKIRPEDYRRVYGGMLAPDVTLDAIYDKHNRENRPPPRDMRSLSMSDIVVLNRAGQRQAFYVDRIGFTECREFLEPKSRAKSQRKTRKRTPKKQER